MVHLRRALALAFLVGLLVAGWSFAAANGGPVTVSYVLGTFQNVPLWRALIGSFALGAVGATVVCLYQVARLGLVARRLRKALGRLEAELHELRTLPLAGEGERLRKPEDEAAGLPASSSAGRSV